MTRFGTDETRRCARSAIFAGAAAWLVVGWVATALAGGGPENVCVAVNSRSWASLAIANEYVRLRKIPAINVVYVDVPQIEATDVQTFRAEILLPILKTLEERGIAGHIDCVAYSSDFPTAIDVRGDVENVDLPRIITPTASINGLTYLYRYTLAGDPGYLRLDVNQYMRLPRAVAALTLLTPEQKTKLGEAGQAMGRREWAEAEKLLTATAETLREPTAIVEMQLACVQARLDRPDDAIARLRRAVEAGWTDAAATENNEHLASLRERDDFKAIVESLKAPRLDVLPALAFHSAKAWKPGGEADPQARDRYLLSTVLAVTSGRGNSVAEAIDALRASVAADGTRPAGTVYFMTNNDVRAKTRQPAFAAAVAKLKELGVEAEVLEGNVPQDKADVAGAMIGVADFDWARSGSKILPGAICEHLTSLGGVMRERGGQTPLSELIRHGAAGASGTVTEPFAIQAKFPFPFIHVHYASGCNLAEAFYQSVHGPYQLLIVGDPLCRPFATIPPVEIDGAKAGDAVGDVVSLVGRTRPEFQEKLGRWELFVDGRRKSVVDPWATAKWDSAVEAEGWHEIALVGVTGDAVETTGRATLDVVVGSGERKFEVVAPAADSLAWETPFKLSAKLDGARRITFFHNRREIGAIDGAEGSVEIEPAVLGPGPVRIEAVALVAEPRLTRVNARPIELTIPFPAVLPAQEPPSKRTPGVRATSGDQRIDVTDTFAGDWFSKLGFAADAEFALEGWFESPGDEPQQFQIETNLPVALAIDGREFPLGERDGWRLIPFRAAAGWHRFRLTGKTTAEPRLSIRYGARGATSLDAGRFSVPE